MGIYNTNYPDTEYERDGKNLISKFFHWKKKVLVKIKIEHQGLNFFSNN